MWAVWNNYNNLRLSAHLYIAVTLCLDQFAFEMFIIIMNPLIYVKRVSSMVLALSRIQQNQIFPHYEFLKLKVMFW